MEGARRDGAGCAERRRSRRVDFNAQSIAKALRSRGRYRRSAGEKLYVIKSVTYDGTFIYTKGTIRRHQGAEVFYVLVSAKIATSEE